eukprot:1053207-Prymnesium_polylepis.1
MRPAHSRIGLRETGEDRGRLRVRACSAEGKRRAITTGHTLLRRWPARCARGSQQRAGSWKFVGEVAEQWRQGEPSVVCARGVDRAAPGWSGDARMGRLHG